MADKSITKTELVASIASATGQSQSAVSGVLDSLFSTVSEAVAQGQQGLDPRLDLVRAGRDVGSHRPQPADGRRDQDPRGQAREGHRRLEAEGRRQVATSAHEGGCRDAASPLCVPLRSRERRRCGALRLGR